MTELQKPETQTCCMTGGAVNTPCPNCPAAQPDRPHEWNLRRQEDGSIRIYEGNRYVGTSGNDPAAQPVPIQGEGPYKVERRISNMDNAQVYVLTGPTITADEYLTPSFPYAAAKDLNAAYLEGHQAGASSKDQVVEAAEEMVSELGDFRRWFGGRTDAYEIWQEFNQSLNKPTNKLAAALNPNSETEK